MSGFNVADKKVLLRFLSNHNISLKPEDLGTALVDVLEQLIDGLTKGSHEVEVRLTIYDDKPSLSNVVSNNIFYADGKIHIDGITIKLPVQLTEDEIYEFESPYISALCEAYSDAVGSEITQDNIEEQDPIYKTDYIEQRRAYLSAEGIQRSVRDVYADGENQFDYLKEEVFDGVIRTYRKPCSDGFERLNTVIEKVMDISLNKSALMQCQNLIGNKERQGVLHILVNDEKIKSWVDTNAG